MAPTNSYGQEMVSIYLIKIKITTKFFNLRWFFPRNYVFAYLPFNFQVLTSTYMDVSLRVGSSLCSREHLRSIFDVAVQSSSVLELIAVLLAQTFVPLFSFHQRMILTASGNTDVLFSRHLFFSCPFFKGHFR